MGKALYRKYRSRKLSEIVGQEHVTTLLANALKTDRVAHAYLFTGPKGVGKTSIARILAHEINDLPYSDESIHFDIIEIDAASNNGVDDIRDLRDKVNLAPTSAKKKIYIIDEVHMLSKQAFNALLKTLEEPPEHVVFILATTDLDKLPETIISRTQRHTFRRAGINDIVKNLEKIARAESIKISNEALELIAEHSDGSYRDSVSLLDQLANTSEKGETILPDMIEQSLGLAPKEQVTAILSLAQVHDFTGLVEALKETESKGIQAKILAEQLIALIQKQLPEHPELLKLLDELLTVSQSQFPHIKLLAVLGSFAAPKSPPTKTMAAIAVPIPKLAKKAIEEHPKDTPTVVAAMPAAQEPVLEKQKKKPSGKTVELNTDHLIAEIKDLSVALYSVLHKCAFTADGQTLTIFARTEFYKKKLEEPKFSQILHDLLVTQTNAEWEIVVIPAQKPSDNQTIAGVAAIMGGGEEVSLET